MSLFLQIPIVNMLSQAPETVDNSLLSSPFSRGLHFNNRTLPKKSIGKS